MKAGMMGVSSCLMMMMRMMRIEEVLLLLVLLRLQLWWLCILCIDEPGLGESQIGEPAPAELAQGGRVSVPAVDGRVEAPERRDEVLYAVVEPHRSDAVQPVLLLEHVLRAEHQVCAVGRREEGVDHVVRDSHGQEELVDVLGSPFSQVPLAELLVVAGDEELHGDLLSHRGLLVVGAANAQAYPSNIDGQVLIDSILLACRVVHCVLGEVVIFHSGLLHLSPRWFYNRWLV